MMRLYSIKEFEDIVIRSDNDRRYMTLKYKGCYGDPVEFGYIPIYVYDVTYKGHKYILEIEENFNELYDQLHFDNILVYFNE